MPEQHKDGAWHIHGLLARCGEMEVTDSGHRIKGSQTIVPEPDTEKVDGTIQCIADSLGCEMVYIFYLETDVAKMREVRRT